VTADNTLWDYYISYWRPFGELLTELEKEGMMVDKVHLAGAQLKAEAEQSEAEKRFRDWAMSFCEDAKYMNVGSGPQVRQLLFAGARNKRGDKEAVPMERVFNVPNVDGLIEEGKKVAKKNMQITLYGLGIPIAPTIFTASGVPAVSAPALRDLAGNPGHAHALLQKLDASENPATKQELLKEAEDKCGGKAKAFDAFNGGREGLSACSAIDALCEMAAIDTLLSNFIIPLQ
ncbi:hypothetical protein CYMTET_7356, partial [Cymbomonas tetramitiformis]